MLTNIAFITSKVTTSSKSSSLNVEENDLFIEITCKQTLIYSGVAAKRYINIYKQFH
jgi:hypothetical protein